MQSIIYDTYLLLIGYYLLSNYYLFSEDSEMCFHQNHTCWVLFCPDSGCGGAAWNNNKAAELAAPALLDHPEDTMPSMARGMQLEWQLFVQFADALIIGCYGCSKLMWHVH